MCIHIYNLYMHIYLLIIYMYTHTCSMHTEHIHKVHCLRIESYNLISCFPSFPIPIRPLRYVSNEIVSGLCTTHTHICTYIYIYNII